MSFFRVVLLMLSLPALAFADACDISFEGVTENSTREEVIAAWSKTGLVRVENPAPSRKKFNMRAAPPNVDIVAFRFPPDSIKPAGLMHLRWERYDDGRTLKIKAGYNPGLPQASGIYNKMEQWALWPMIAERKKQCVGAADLRDRNAAVRCKDQPGHLVVDRQERAYEVKQGQPPRQRVSTQYACRYQFNAGPGPSVTEEVQIVL